MPRISRARQREVRGRILEAGLRVFEEHGFRRASMQAIAAEAALSIGALYTYFTGKEELFLAALEETFEDEQRLIEAALAAASGTAERLGLAVAFWLDLAILREQPGFRGKGAGFLLHAWANVDEQPALRAVLLRRRDQIETIGRLVVREGMARGELAAWTDVDALTGGLTSMLDALILQRAERGAAFGREEAARRATAVVQAVLAAAAVARPPDFVVPGPVPSAGGHGPRRSVR